MDADLKFKGKAFYALFPMWFVRGEYKGKNVVLLVNGQTGKVVGGPEYSKKMFTAAALGVSVVPIIAMSVVGTVLSMGAFLSAMNGSLYTCIGLVVALISLCSAICAMEERRMKQIRDIIDLSSSRRLVKFTSRRKV